MKKIYPFAIFSYLVLKEFYYSDFQKLERKFKYLLQFSTIRNAVEKQQPKILSVSIKWVYEKYTHLHIPIFLSIFKIYPLYVYPLFQETGNIPICRIPIIL